jgi:hypothetical protein
VVLEGEPYSTNPAFPDDGPAKRRTRLSVSCDLTGSCSGIESVCIWTSSGALIMMAERREYAEY